MSEILVIDDDRGTLGLFEETLTNAGHRVSVAESGAEGLDLFARRRAELAITDLMLPDISGMDVLRTIRRGHADTAVVIVTGHANTRDAVQAMRLGAADFVEKPLFDDGLLAVVDHALGSASGASAASSLAAPPADSTAHAAARWAHALVGIIDSPGDPKTLAGWARWVAASPGALRNWCRTAGMPTRQSLVFGRLLRAVHRSDGGRHRPENLLDVVDRRTLLGLLRWAGLRNDDDLPTDVYEFLDRQTLVRDPDTLRETRRVLELRLGRQTALSPTTTLSALKDV